VAKNHILPSGRQSVPRPPLNAEFFLYLFLPTDRCDNLVGDLAQRYFRLARRLGPARAGWWYRMQVFTSIWPLFRGALRRVSSSAVVSAVAFGLRLAGLGPYADELKEVLRKRMGSG
jgi:hypothetical protein